MHKIGVIMKNYLYQVFLMQGHYLLAVSLVNLGQHREALTAFLNALDLDTDPNHADILATHIASTAQHFCDIPDNLINNLVGMFFF